MSIAASAEVDFVLFKVFAVAKIQNPESRPETLSLGNGDACYWPIKWSVPYEHLFYLIETDEKITVSKSGLAQLRSLYK